MAPLRNGRTSPGVLGQGPNMTETNLAGLRALVADDNPINLQIIDSFLRRLGVTTTLVENGRQAVEAWAPGRFDILCLDIAMPELSGTEVLHDLRQRARNSGTALPPAVAITARALPAQVAEYLAAGFDGCIAKPVRRLQIGDEIARLLGRQIAELG
jgi:CheY-like chemotaxis protein